MVNKFLLAGTLLMAATAAHSFIGDDSNFINGDARIRDGRIDAETQEIVLKVSYGGGCGEHRFSIDVGSCLETFPVQCRDAQLIHSTNDGCEALIHKEIRITFAEAGLNDAYFERARLTIHGHGGTSVDLQMP